MRLHPLAKSNDLGPISAEQEAPRHSDRAFVRLDLELESLAALEPHRQAVNDAHHAHVATFIGESELIGESLVRA